MTLTRAIASLAFPPSAPIPVRRGPAPAPIVLRSFLATSCRKKYPQLDYSYMIISCQGRDNWRSKNCLTRATKTQSHDSLPWEEQLENMVPRNGQIGSLQRCVETGYPRGYALHATLSLIRGLFDFDSILVLHLGRYPHPILVPQHWRYYCKASMLNVFYTSLY